MSNWATNVHQFEDGVDSLSAASINPVVTALANRDQYLFEQLNNIAAETMLVSTNQPMSVNFAPGTPVYFNTSGGSVILNPAIGSYSSDLNDGHLFPSESSYIFGVVKQVYGGSGTGGVFYGDVYVRGLINDSSINFYNLLDTESASNISSLNPRPLFLSSKESGKLTIFPSGATIFVGYYLGGNQFILAPNIDSLNQLYFNYRLYLDATPAGTPSQNMDTTWTIDSASVDNLGWISTSDASTLLGITAPSGALFYYNIPTDEAIEAALGATNITVKQAQDAFLLKKALPAHPSSYTMLFVNGVLQTAYDSDHATGTYIIDDNGIWWTNNSNTYKPWGNGVTIEVFITKLNPNFASSIVTSLTSANQAIKITDQTGTTESTGDLQLQLNLNVVPTSGNGNGSVIQALAFDTQSGNILTTTAPVINSIVAGPGLNYSLTNGQATISLVNFALSGEVTDIEPEEADFTYKGLNSYLRLKRPQANQRIGFIGKMKVPGSVPAGANLTFSLIGFTETGSVSGSTASFAFEYAVTNNGSSISTALTSSNTTIPGTSFPTLTQATVSLNGSSNPCFVIPAANFSASSYVNFRIARTYDVSATYANPIGIIGVTWTIA